MNRLPDETNFSETDCLWATVTVSTPRGEGHELDDHLRRILAMPHA